MNKKFLLLSLLLVLVAPYAQAASSLSAPPPSDKTFQGQLSVPKGGTDATALGTTITNSGGTLNVSSPLRHVTGTSDTISCSTDSGMFIDYSNTSPIAVSMSSASAAGCGLGFGFTVQNKGAGLVTMTPASGYINGAASLTVPTGTGCAVLSDGSDYNVGLCTALGLSGIVNGVDTQTTSYTLVRGDATALVSMNCSTACSLTVPPNADVPFPVNTTITWQQTGAGALTLVAGTGVTINKLSTLNAVGQYAVGSLVQTSANVWTAFGALQ